MCSQWIGLPRRNFLPSVKFRRTFICLSNTVIFNKPSQAHLCMIVKVTHVSHKIKTCDFIPNQAKIFLHENLFKIHFKTYFYVNLRFSCKKFSTSQSYNNVIKFSYWKNEAFSNMPEKYLMGSVFIMFVLRISMDLE